MPSPRHLVALFSVIASTSCAQSDELESSTQALTAMTDDKKNADGQATPGVISTLPEKVEDKIKAIQDELAKKPQPIVVTPEGEFGTPDKPYSQDDVKNLCANFPSGTVIVGVYISPPTPPTNSAVICKDGKVLGQEDKKSYGPGEDGKITLKPDDPYKCYGTDPNKYCVIICADIYNEKLDALKGPTIYLIADYEGTDLAEVIKKYQLAACEEHDLTTAPTIIVSNSNGVGGSGTYPGFPCPKKEPTDTTLLSSPTVSPGL